LGEATKLAKKNLPDFMAFVFDLSPEEDKAFRKILTPRLSEAIVEFTHDAIERGADMDFDIAYAPVQKDSESSITLTFEFVQSIPQQAGPGEPLPIEPVFKVRFGCKRV
jgi:hypothetical protein